MQYVITVPNPQKHRIGHAVAFWSLFLVHLCIKDKGSMPERLNGADCNSAGLAYAGSNPARPKDCENPLLFWGRTHVIM